jgi:hypothetical protein
MATGGMCSKESGIESNRTFMGAVLCVALSAPRERKRPFSVPPMKGL